MPRACIALITMLLIPVVALGQTEMAPQPQQPPQPTQPPQPQVKIRSGTIGVDGGQLFYEIAGSGSPVVLLHDGLLHRVVWEDQMAPFAAEHTVIRYDRRGYGKSSPPEAEYSNIDDLLAVLDTLRIEKACLIGISAGGGLAIDFSLAHPERVSSLVLVGAVVSGMSYSEHFLSRGGYFPQEIRNDPVEFRHYWFEKDPYTIMPENSELRNLASGILEANPQNLAPENYRLLRRAERPALPDLGEIEAPTLIVVGDHDIPDVHAHAGAIEAGIEGAQRIVLYQCGHLVPMEQPEAFNRMVLDFLNGINLFQLLKEGKVDEAVAIVTRLRDRDQLPFTLDEVNLRGFRAMKDGKVNEAIALFRLNTAAFPDSWSAHDNLGEAYRVAGQKEKAIAAYRKSQELNPEGKNSSERLKELQAAQQ